MTRWLGLGLLALGVLATFGLGAPSGRVEKREIPLGAFRQTSMVVPYRGGEPALVIASGNGRSPLALYIYDKHGNCVARDDLVDPRSSSDDLAVEWIPSEDARYTVELRNVGTLTNTVSVVLR